MSTGDIVMLVAGGLLGVFSAVLVLLHIRNLDQGR